MSFKEIEAHLNNNEILQSIEKLYSLSKKLGVKEVEHWTELEVNGFFSKMNDDDIVPDYRIVGGQYKDGYGRPLHITDSKLAFLNEYRLRNPLSQLLKMSSEGHHHFTIKDPEMLEVINKELRVPVVCYSFPASSLETIFSILRTKIRESLVIIEEHLKESEVDFSSSDFYQNLHPKILNVSGKLFQNGHYRQALLDAYILLISEVKSASKLDKDGVGLVQSAFSKDNPKIKVSDDSDERLGFMWLFSGAVMGIRNPNAHYIKDVTCPQETLEWLGLASALLRILDKSETA